MDTNQNLILKTLCYSDIFDYPLTFQQIWKFCPGNLTKKEISTALSTMGHIVKKKSGYYFLTGRDSIVTTRIERKIESAKKVKKAERIAKILSLIPTILLIGLSGSLAVENCEEAGDIDFFIITRRQSLWISRFAVNVLVVLLGEKRKRQEESGQDKICPNMFLTEDMLSTDKKTQSLFMAHEIAQVKVLFNKNDTYEKFLTQNAWVLQTLPHAFRLPLLPVRKSSRSAINFFVSVIDSFCYFLQLLYMKNHITTERITKDSALFHPNDQRYKTLSRYQQNYRLYRKKLKKFVYTKDNNKISRFNWKNSVERYIWSFA